MGSKRDKKMIGRLLGAGLMGLRQATHTFLGEVGCCRFQPTCSNYCRQAVEEHPPLRAFGLCIGRLWRCRPGGGSGFDPVPRGNRQALV